ncbi:MAG: hypothetical protein ACFFCS_22665 [Candidatus Hodarchaeota archaeon]
MVTMVIMVTTIQLQSSTKEDLLVIKAKLEQETGKKSTLDDAIRWLIEKSNSPPFEIRLQATEELFGSIKDLGITTDDLKELRRQESSRVAKF